MSMKRIPRRVIEVPWQKVVRVYFVGDTHIGHPCLDEKLLSKTIAAIARDRKGIVVGMGDYIDAIVPRDPRFDIAAFDGLTDLDDIIRSQIVQFVAHWKPLAKRTAVFLSGNHEDAVRKHANRNVYRDIAERLKLPNEALFGVNGFLRIHVIDRPGKRGWPVDIYMHHGHGGGRKDGSHINRLADMMAAVRADVYAMGHVHRPIRADKAYIDFDGEHEAEIIINGSFLSSDCPGYANDKMLPAVARGASVLEIYPNKRLLRSYRLTL